MQQITLNTEDIVNIVSSIYAKQAIYIAIKHVKKG